MAVFTAADCETASSETSIHCACGSTFDAYETLLFPPLTRRSTTAAAARQGGATAALSRLLAVCAEMMGM